MLKHVLLSMLIVLLCNACSGTDPVAEPDKEEARGAENRAYFWGEVSLEATARDTERFNPRPTVTSRYLGLIWTAVFDAWSRYDAAAAPFYLAEGVERRPESERTVSNKEIAISYAAYGTLKEYYYSDAEYFESSMRRLGLDPMNTTLDPTTPEGIGNLAAKSVIDARRSDGSNQYGDHPDAAEPYGDYTGYAPVNPVDTLNDLNRWQPKYFADGKGGRFVPGCLTPYWDKVTPVVLKSADQFRPGPPPMVGSDQLAAEVREVVELQATLTDEQRALVEFMRDGPQSVQQAGHWLKFAQDVSRRDSTTLDEDVIMYINVQLTAMDGFIACWDSKMFYDYARPYALVHDYYQDQLIEGWAGPDGGWKKIHGQEWRPYSPETFLCPPFPAYVSGHSTISGGCGEVLKLVTGADHFGESVDLVPGIMTEPNNLGETVTLHFPTFTETADMAGISRVLGGYHIQADNIEGLELGRRIARYVYAQVQQHLKGNRVAGAARVAKKS